MKITHRNNIYLIGDRNSPSKTPFDIDFSNNQILFATRYAQRIKKILKINLTGGEYGFPYFKFNEKQKQYVKLICAGVSPKEVVRKYLQDTQE